jgi:choline dehydrogenase
MEAPALATHIKAEVLAGNDVQTDAELVADIKARAETIYHPVRSQNQAIVHVPFATSVE